MIVFGPVPSRRLGYSLGINHIPPKHCSYSCVYCQAGRTTTLGIARREFYPVDRILQEVETRVKECEKIGQAINYLSLVPDGEPTLDFHLGRLIERLKQFGIPIAVISNATLIGDEAVQNALDLADWVSLKVDAVNEADWKKINRPHPRLSLPDIRNAILDFRRRFQGELVTETMLVSGVNDSPATIHDLSGYLLELQPFKAYIAIPTRPPAEIWVKSPDSESLDSILPILFQRLSFIELLFDTEILDFISTGNVIEDILSIVAVHPIREEPLRKMVAQSGAEWTIVEDLVHSGKITRISYREETFFLCSSR